MVADEPAQQRVVPLVLIVNYVGMVGKRIDTVFLWLPRIRS